MRLIMGIDPGSRITGWGIIKSQGEIYKVVDYGVIVMTQESLSHRLLCLANALNKIMEQFCPQEVVVEKIFLGKNTDSAFKLGHARGVSLMCAAKNNLTIFEYAARKVKQSLTGSGAASKEQVQLLAKAMLNLKGEIPLDASDALSLALCHSIESKVIAKLQRVGMRENVL